MSEERNDSPSVEEIVIPKAEEETTPKVERRSRTSNQRRRQNSVFRYIGILFAAAFVLLLLTFLMERHQHELLQKQSENEINNLQQSASAVQSLQNLYAQNDALKEKVKDLEEQLKALKAENQQLTTQQGESAAKAVAAMDWFWQIDEAYSKGRYSLCRSLIKKMEAAELVDSLPKESSTDTGRYSPADRYQEIYKIVF